MTRSVHCSWSAAMMGTLSASCCSASAEGNCGRLEGVDGDVWVGRDMWEDEDTWEDGDTWEEGEGSGGATCGSTGLLYRR